MKELENSKFQERHLAITSNERSANEYVSIASNWAIGPFIGE